MSYETFCGGLFETNCYLFEAPDGPVLFDAPEGACEWLGSKGIVPVLLILTHGHIDHIQDAAKIKKRFQCPVGCHRETVPMIADPEFFRRFGFGFEIDPVDADILIEASESRDLGGRSWTVLEVPGHCPGSLCFLARDEKVMVGGDVLFAGGVGRWDLPGGNGELLFREIKTKLWPLDDEVTVLPGHGPPTTIGVEKRTNPFVGEQ